MHVGDVLAALSLVLYPGVLGFPSGAPGDTCVTMMPNHGVSEQTTFSPYSISTSSDWYHAPDQPITVSIIGGTFKGLLLQARLASDSSQVPVGSFFNNTAGTRTMDCGLLDDAITHSNRDLKLSLSAVWVPPSPHAGVIKFVATVVESREVFWTNIESTEIMPDRCYNDGTFIDVGSTIQATDGCNTCQCLSGGALACTEMWCQPNITTGMTTNQPDPGCPVFDCVPVDDCPKLIPNYHVINGHNCSTCPTCDYSSSANPLRHGTIMMMTLIIGPLLH